MKHYTIDEFNGTNTSTDNTIDVLIDKKVSLLYDFCILSKHDNRENAVRRLLAQYSTEQQMSRVLHNVLVGDCTLNHILKQKGMIS